MELISYFNTWVASFVRAHFGRSERGASLVEYVLLVSLIAVVCIAAITFLGNSAKGKFSTVGSSIAA
jgi:pilus assembly protein Flp/PilA